MCVCVCVCVRVRVCVCVWYMYNMSEICNILVLCICSIFNMIDFIRLALVTYC